jgi:hypothetical protein
MESKAVAIFNKIVGKEPSEDSCVLAEQVTNQSTILLEEVLETKEASKLSDWEKMLDGVCDVWFVSSELVTQLISVGIDVKRAFKAVCENNALKYTTSYELAEKWYTWNACTNNIDCHIHKSEYEGQNYYCVRRNEDNKVLKWEEFPTVDLKRFIPKELLNKEN